MSDELERKMALKGGIVYVSHDEIYGWARFSGDPYRPPIVQAILNGNVVAEARADMHHEPFASLGGTVAACAFMLDIGSSGIIPPVTLTIMAEGEPLPRGIVDIKSRPSNEEVYIEKDSIAHVLAYRTGDFQIMSKEPLEELRLYSRARYTKLDKRRLGVLIGAIYLDELQLDMDRNQIFSCGFHNIEVSPLHVVRWTDGRAKLDFRTHALPRSVRFHVYSLAPGI